MDQLELVRSLGVSHIQGWVYGKPMRGSELVQQLEKGEWKIEPKGPARQRSERLATFRKVGLIHGSRYSTAILRNLSQSGALIDKAASLPMGARVLLDLGDSQLALARVARSSGTQVGLAFEEDLIDDGDGGFSPRQKVAPYKLAQLGLPQPGEADRDLTAEGNPLSFHDLAGLLGLDAEPGDDVRKAGLRLNWLVSKFTEARAARGRNSGRAPKGYLLSIEEGMRLLEAATGNPNRHLANILILLMLTGARLSDVLKARWDEFDLEHRIWRPGVRDGARAYEILLSEAACRLVSGLPQAAGCDYLLPNPTTNRPYRSIARSWEAVKAKAGLSNVELEDLPLASERMAEWEDRLLAVVRTA